MVNVIRLFSSLPPHAGDKSLFLMEESNSSKVAEDKDQLDFPSLLIDQEGDSLSPDHVEPLPATDTPQRTATSTGTEHPGSSGEDREDKEEEVKSNHEPQSGPSRMVTRSQTAAVRRPSYSLSSPDLEIDYGQPQRSFQGDKVDQSIPSELIDLSDEDDSEDLSDLSSGKSSPRGGIDLGSVCPRCGAVLMTVSSRIAHNAAHGQQGAHCRYCKQVFITMHGRDAHQHLHGDARTVDVDDYCECVLCGGAFISVMNLELHLLELHGRQAMMDPAAFRMGISSGGEGDGGTESGWALYHCGVCGHKFTYSFNLDCHMVLHARPSYCCAMCDASFSSFDPLIAHVRTHRQPAMLAPIIHLSASTPASTATQASTLVPVPPTNFNLSDAARKPGQSQGSLMAQSPHAIGLHRNPVDSRVPGSALLNTPGTVTGVPSTQTMLNYLLSQPENRPGPSQPSRRGYFGLKVMQDAPEEKCPPQGDRNKQQRDRYSR